VSSTATRSRVQTSIATWRARQTARLAAWRLFKLLDAAFHLIQPLVGLLGGLIGGFGALGCALHPRVELIQARVDCCKLVVIGGAAGKAQGGDERHAERTCHCQRLLGRKHCDPPFVRGPENTVAFWRSHDPTPVDDLIRRWIVKMRQFVKVAA
jgi:hypothetical protein